MTVVLILTMVLVPFSVVSAQGDTIVRVSDPGVIDPGEQFTIDIIVEPEVAIAGVQFNLSFDSSLVTVDDVTEGDLLSQNGATTYFTAGTIDNVAGTVSAVAGAITTPGQVVSTSGTFATITLTAGTQGGTSLLTLTNVVVGDINGEPVQVSMVNGQVQINQYQGSGGGGGGDGGTGGVTSLLDSMTMEGRIVNEVVATDDDKKVKLIIPEGTIVKNRFGQIVSHIIIEQSEESLAVGPNSRVISLFYDIEPSQATFEPSATLVFQFNEAELPEEISENSLYIALWDPVTGEWIDLGGEVDPTANTISVLIQHLSTYALMAHARPASFEFSDFHLSSQEIEQGESITFSVFVTNTGDLTGDCGVSLKVDGGVIETKTVTIGGGDSERAYFNITPTSIGKHKASIGDLSVMFVVNEVQAPASFITSNLVVSPIEINVGDDVYIRVLVSNIGDLSGTYNTILRVDNTVADAREIEVAGGESKVVSFSITSEAAGQHVVTIDSLQATYTVKAPLPYFSRESVNPGIVISDFVATPVYYPETDKLTSTKIEYQLDGLQEQSAETKLILKTSYEGEPLEEILILSLSQLQSDEYSGSYIYIPSAGWQTGLYSFQAELYEGGNSIQSTEPQQFTVTPQDISTVFAWSTLAKIIGATLIVTVAILAIVFVRRRDMLSS